jgi:hypothetical protein
MRRGELEEFCGLPGRHRDRYRCPRMCPVWEHRAKRLHSVGPRTCPAMPWHKRCGPFRCRSLPGGDAARAWLARRRSSGSQAEGILIGSAAIVESARQSARTGATELGPVEPTEANAAAGWLRPNGESVVHSDETGSDGYFRRSCFPVQASGAGICRSARAGASSVRFRTSRRASSGTIARIISAPVIRRADRTASTEATGPAMASPSG